MSAASSVDLLICLVLGAALVVFGRWGRGHVHELVPRSLSDEEQQLRENVMRRGATTCIVVGIIFAVAGFVLALS